MPGDELRELCEQIERDFAAGNLQSALDLIGSQGPAIWYGLRPERFRSILEVAIRTGTRSSELAEQLRLFVTAGDKGQFPADMVPNLLNSKDPLQSSMGQIARMIDLRLRGHAHVASTFLDELNQQALAIRPLFDTQAGWQLLLSIQCGITAMLAGSFTQALLYFTAARSHVIVPTLVFLNRDALVKSAIIHAFFGDPDQARRMLEEAGRFPRTISWIEPLIDAHASIAKARLESDPALAAEMLESIPLRDLGEMWPFYVLALHHVLFRTGRVRQLKERIATLEQLGFPRAEGEGFTGSVFPLTRAAIGLGQGVFETPEWFIAKADPEYFGTQLAEAALSLALGRRRKAIATAQAVRAEVGLRQVGLWRDSILAEAFIGLMQFDAARSTLRSAMTAEGGIRPEDLIWFSQETRSFASEAISDWPRSTARPEEAESLANRSAPPEISGKQREILRLLATGAPRIEMARELFISVNTLKSHLRVIYKKLDATSRHEAIIRAQIEGWL